MVGLIDDVRIYDHALSEAQIKRLAGERKSLVGHWPLNGNTEDVSGFGNDGTPSNITYTSGLFGNAATFNGTDSLININEFAMDSDSTVSFWYYWTGTGIEMPIGKLDFDNYFSLNDNTYVIQDHANITQNWNTAPNKNKWTHCILRRNGTE
jgi:hypothetical protein